MSVGGTPENFAAHAQDLPGRIALVRHELMFAAKTIHRSRKFAMAREHGAVGFPDCRTARRSHRGRVSQPVRDG